MFCLLLSPFILILIYLSFLFFFSCKMLYCFHLVPGLEKASSVVKKLPSGFRERRKQKPWHKDLWAVKAPSRDWRWAFPRGTCPAQPGDQPAWDVSQVVAIFLMSFTSVSRKWFSRKSQTYGSGTLSGQIQNGPAQGLLQYRSSFHGIQGFTSLILGQLLHILGMVPTAGFVSWRDAGAWSFSSGKSQKRAAYPPEPHCHGGSSSPERGKCRRRQIHADQAVDSGLHPGGIIVRNVGGHGWWVVSNSAPNTLLAGLRGRGWLRRCFWRLQLEKKLGGGLRLEEEASLGLFHPNMVEARDRSAGLPAIRLKTFISNWHLFFPLLIVYLIHDYFKDHVFKYFISYIFLILIPI